MAILHTSDRDTRLPAAVNRRDFLQLKTQNDLRVLELSCERLYMQYVDAGSLAESPRPFGKTDSSQLFWDGEPSSQFESVTTGQLFEQLEQELANADVLRILGADWLTRRDFGRRVEACVAAFRRHGGHVEFDTRGE